MCCIIQWNRILCRSGEFESVTTSKLLKVRSRIAKRQFICCVKALRQLQRCFIWLQVKSRPISVLRIRYIQKSLLRRDRMPTSLALMHSAALHLRVSSCYISCLCTCCPSSLSRKFEPIRLRTSNVVRIHALFWPRIDGEVSIASVVCKQRHYFWYPGDNLQDRTECCQSDW